MMSLRRRTFYDMNVLFCAFGAFWFELLDTCAVVLSTDLKYVQNLDLKPAGDDSV
jgi:hypothetical protein